MLLQTVTNSYEKNMADILRRVDRESKFRLAYMCILLSVKRFFIHNFSDFVVIY